MAEPWNLYATIGVAWVCEAGAYAIGSWLGDGRRTSWQKGATPSFSGSLTEQALKIRVGHRITDQLAIVQKPSHLQRGFGPDPRRDARPGAETPHPRRLQLHWRRQALPGQHIQRQRCAPGDFGNFRQGQDRRDEQPVRARRRIQAGSPQDFVDAPGRLDQPGSAEQGRPAGCLDAVSGLHQPVLVSAPRSGSPPLSSDSTY